MQRRKSGPHVKISKETRSKIIGLGSLHDIDTRAPTYTIRQICEKIKTEEKPKYHTLWRILKQAGISRKSTMPSVDSPLGQRIVNLASRMGQTSREPGKKVPVFTYKQVSEKIGVPCSQVIAVLREAEHKRGSGIVPINARPRGRPADLERVRAVLQLGSQTVPNGKLKYTLSEIATKVKTTKQNVSLILIKNGLRRIDFKGTWKNKKRSN